MVVIDASHIAVYFMCGLSLVAGFVLICAYSGFQRLRLLPIIQLRFPNIVQIEARVCIVFLVVLIPVTLSNRLWLSDHLGHNNKHQLLLETVLVTIVNPAISRFIGTIEAMRLWLMYYELMMLKSLQTEEWGSKITTKFWRTDYWLKHRGKRGNVVWISRRVFVYWVIVSTLLGTFSFYVHTHDVPHRWVVAAYGKGTRSTDIVLNRRSCLVD